MIATGVQRLQIQTQMYNAFNTLLKQKRQN